MRDIGTCYSVNRMLTMDSVKTRLEREQPMSFLEFNYMLLQGYDFCVLYNKYGCRAQIAGSDQWGNITSGTELGRRRYDVELFGFTSPIITDSNGKKWANRRVMPFGLTKKSCPPMIIISISVISAMPKSENVCAFIPICR